MLAAEVASVVGSVTLSDTVSAASLSGAFVATSTWVMMYGGVSGQVWFLGITIKVESYKKRAAFGVEANGWLR